MYRKRFITRNWLVIMEAEESHDLLSATWRPRKAGGVVPVQTPRLEKQEAHGIRPSSSLKPKNQEP